MFLQHYEARKKWKTEHLSYPPYTHARTHTRSDTHLAEDGLVGFREEPREFLGVTEVERQPADTQTPGVQLLLVAQLVDVHPLNHQRAVVLHHKKHGITFLWGGGQKHQRHGKALEKRSVKKVAAS